MLRLIFDNFSNNLTSKKDIKEIKDLFPKPALVKRIKQ